MGKRFLRAPRGSERGGRLDKRELERERRRVRGMGPKVPPVSPSLQRLTRASLLCQCCLCQPGRETKHLVLGRV